MNIMNNFYYNEYNNYIIFNEYNEYNESFLSS